MQTTTPFLAARQKRKAQPGGATFCNRVSEAAVSSPIESAGHIFSTAAQAMLIAGQVRGANSSLAVVLPISCHPHLGRLITVLRYARMSRTGREWRRGADQIFLFIFRYTVGVDDDGCSSFRQQANCRVDIPASQPFISARNRNKRSLPPGGSGSPLSKMPGRVNRPSPRRVSRSVLNARPESCDPRISRQGAGTMKVEI